MRLRYETPWRSAHPGEHPEVTPRTVHAGHWAVATSLAMDGGGEVEALGQRGETSPGERGRNFDVPPTAFPKTLTNQTGQ